MEGDRKHKNVYSSRYRTGLIVRVGTIGHEGSSGQVVK